MKNIADAKREGIAFLPRTRHWDGTGTRSGMASVPYVYIGREFLGLLFDDTGILLSDVTGQVQIQNATFHGNATARASVRSTANRLGNGDQPLGSCIISANAPR